MKEVETLNLKKKIKRPESVYVGDEPARPSILQDDVSDTKLMSTVLFFFIAHEI